MPATRKREAIVLSEEQVQRLQSVLSSKNGSRSTMVRARVLLRYTRGEPIKAIARKEGISRPTVQLCIDKALSGGIETAIQDLTRPGRPPTVDTEGRAWVMQLACSKPTDHGYRAELWTLSQLTAHIRRHAAQTGNGCLEHASKYMIRRILKESSHSPHNVAYYFDKESLEASEGTSSVLFVIKEVQLRGNRTIPPHTHAEGDDGRACGEADQTLEITAHLLPEPQSHPLWFQNRDQKPQGTARLLVGIDLLDGRVIALVYNKDRGNGVGEFLKTLDSSYPPPWRIRIVPGTGATAASRDNLKDLKNYPNRFELDEHHSEGLWLNLLEVFFTRMITSFLRSLRVNSQAEFMQRMNQYLDEMNLLTLKE